MHPKSTRSRLQFVKLCDCGCGQPTLVAPYNHAKKGWVAGQPLSFIGGHQSRPFAPLYHIDARGCWVWQRALSWYGYGRTTDGGRARPAHVVFYEHLVGPVPPGKLLDHLCRNRACVNPAHLEPVTFTENMRRASNTKLTLAIAREIRALAGTMSHRAIGELYRIDKSQITRIINHRIWKEGVA